MVLGSALTEAEATDGVLTFDVKPAGDGAVKQVTVRIPVLGAYSETFPLNCAKSQRSSSGPPSSMRARTG